MICLQGGAEFGAACGPMDAHLLARAAASGVGGAVVIVALATAPGREYAAAVANGVRHFRGLGAEEVLAAPDARTDPAGAAAAVGDAALVVLPGGAPRRLLGELSGSPVGEAIVRHVARGGPLIGASAGAMVLCELTVLPGGRRPEVVAGLGLVPGCLVIPHWTAGRRGHDWLGLVPDRLTVLGLPECSGVLIEPGRLTAVGGKPSLVGGRLLAPSDSMDW